MVPQQQAYESAAAHDWRSAINAVAEAFPRLKVTGGVDAFGAYAFLKLRWPNRPSYWSSCIFLRGDLRDSRHDMSRQIRTAAARLQRRDSRTAVKK